MHLSLHELHYRLGGVLHQQGDLLGAAEQYRAAIALQPRDAKTYRQLGVVLLEQGEWLLAVKCYRQSIRLDPTSVTAYSNLGVAFQRQGKLDQAVEVYQQAIALQPDQAALYNNLARALFKLDRTEEAIAAYRQAIQLQPDHVLAHHNLGCVWQSQGQHQQAIACFEQALELAPLTSIYSSYSISLLAIGQIATAIDCFRKVVLAQRSLIEAYCQAYEQTEAPAAADPLIHARAACSRFLKGLCVGDRQVVDHLVQAYLHWGDLFSDYGELAQSQQAERFYRQALQLQPQSLECYLRLGDCLVQQGRFNAAVLLYHLALAMQPQQPEIYEQLGAVLEQQQEWQQSIAYYQLALKQIQSGASSDRDQEKKRRSSVAFKPAAVSLTETPPSTCEGLNCMECLQPILRAYKPVHQGNQVYYLASPTGFTVEPLPIAITALPQGRAWIAPQQNLWLICNAIAIFDRDDQWVPNGSREYPGQLPGCRNADRAPAISRAALPPPKPISGRVAVLSGLSGHVYFHWMLDILPRIEILRRKEIDLNTIDWFVVNSQRLRFQQETLRTLGIPAAKVIESDRQPHLQADELIVPSFPGYLGWAQPWAIQFLRQTFLPASDAAIAADYPERIYISRADALYRRVLNEAEVIDQLQRVGFISVCLGDRSVAEQAALFAHAKVIVAAHGSSLTNLVFCQPGTKVIELVSPNYIRHYYWVISQQLQLEHYLFSSEVVSCAPLRQLMSPNPLTEDIWVDSDSLARIIAITGQIRSSFVAQK